MKKQDILKELHRMVVTKNKVKGLLKQAYDRLHELELEIHILKDALEKKK